MKRIDFKRFVNEKAEEKGVTLTEVAKKCKMAPISLWRYSKDKRRPDLDHAFSVITALECSLSDLYDYVYEDEDITKADIIEQQIESVS